MFTAAVILRDSLPRRREADSVGFVILLAEHDEPSLAAQKKQRAASSKRATSTPQNRVRDFFNSPLGRPVPAPQLSWENATGSVQCSYETASGQGYYYTRDHLGSVREMCSSTGTITSRMAYDPYGNTTVVSGTILPTYGFDGMYWHQTSGLYLTNAGDGSSTGRPYDSKTGRWPSPDPIGERGGINLYEYVGDNPISWRDPMGEDIVVENTNAIAGWHQRLCVDIYDSTCKKIGQKCFTFGNNAKGSCGKLSGTGTVEEDTAPDAGYKTGEDARYKTSCAHDKKVLQALEKMSGSTGDYNVLYCSCRQWSQQTAKQMAQWPDNPKKP
jgi:RHS repeat-associated protein